LPDKVQCPICGLVFSSEEMEFCSSCRRKNCSGDYDYEMNACVDCSTDLEQVYMDEDGGES
jgi:uncharacterized protein (DUF2225 family)